MNPESVIQGVIPYVTPTPAASVWKTFGKLANFMMFFAWLTALPVEVVLNRRVNKRYVNTVFYFMAIVLFSLLTTWLAGTRLEDLRGFGVSEAQKLAAIKQAYARMRPFEHLLLVSLVGFGVHYWSNRKRFGTPDQGHSFDSGIPWLVYPPMADRWLGWWQQLRALMGLKGSRGLEGAGVGGFGASDVSSNGWLDASMTGSHASRQSLLGTVRYLGTRSRSLFVRLAFGGMARWLGYVEHHLAQLRQGVLPVGPVTWLAISVLVPGMLMAVGVSLTYPSYSPLGTYLIIVALAMAFKACMHAATWRERVYDETDQRVEAGAMMNLRSGQPPTKLSTVFTVPITQAVMTTPRFEPIRGSMASHSTEWSDDVPPSSMQYGFDRLPPTAPASERGPGSGPAPTPRDDPSGGHGTLAVR